MTSPAAFQGAYADWKLVKTRGVVQVVIEVPLADADAAYEVLGGMPVAGKERWFGIAAIKSPTSLSVPPKSDEPRPVTDKPRAGAKRWGDMQPAQQAGIRCGEPLFLAFLKEERPDDWHDASEDPAECVRMICRVESRSLLNREEAAQRWQKLNDQFVAWQRVGA